MKGTESDVHHGWDVSFSTDPPVVPKSPDSKTVTTLLLGFFQFCAKFPYKEYIMSPLTGRPIPREAFTKDVFKLPMAIKRHFHHMPPNKLRNFELNLMVVLDPFDLSHNVTSGFTKKQFKRFLILCQESAKLLSEGILSDKCRSQ